MPSKAPEPLQLPLLGGPFESSLSSLDCSSRIRALSFDIMNAFSVSGEGITAEIEREGRGAALRWGRKAPPTPEEAEEAGLEAQHQHSSGGSA